MKYPEYRLSMEAALPSSVQSWFDQELELRGIDSLIYTRYIIRLLQQDSAEVDLDGFDPDVSFLQSKVEFKRQRGKKSEKKKLSVSEEEMKKNAAIQCLLSIADETSGIENLVEELCSRLKNSQQALCSPLVPDSDCQKSSPCSSSDTCTCSSEDSGSELQDPAERYYAAFPALLVQENSTEPSPTTQADTIWKKNPLLKSAEEHLIQVTEDYLIEETEEDTKKEEKKQKKENSKVGSSSGSHKKSQDRTDRESRKRDRLDDKFEIEPNYYRSKSSGHITNQKNESTVKSRRFRSWPAGYAEGDVRCEDKSKKTDAKIMRNNEELCTRVESLLKGILLPIPVKRYKELEDVDDQDAGILPGKYPDSGQNVDVKRAESVSPELQENINWYTEPMEIFSQSTGSSKQRLYKRNSYPRLSPDEDDCNLLSTMSSPNLVDFDNNGFPDDEDSVLMDGSLLIPAWLTSELEMPLQEDALEPLEDLVEKLENGKLCVVRPGCSTSSLHSNLFKTPPDMIDREKMDGLGLPGGSSSSKKQSDGYEEFFTPTPTGRSETVLDRNSSNIGRPRMKSDSPCSTTSLSLVDWEYLSRFSDVQGLPKYDAYLETGLLNCVEDYPVEPGPVACWQSKILFDESLYSFDSEEEENIWRWSWDQRVQQHLGDGENLSQLWNVNNQMKSKTSPWPSSGLYPFLGLWLKCNSLELEEENLSNQIKQLNIELSEQNTLIPQISVEVANDEEMDDEVFTDRDHMKVLYERSISLGEVSSFWDNDEQSFANQRLSQSFELVPSEHSAFDDVPRRLPHVHSEPNLVRYRKLFPEAQIDSSDRPAKSPQEHLYFSPKTHFRPITPAYAPELAAVQPKEPAHLSHDLFGGHFSSKTPYQKFHCKGEEVEGDSFVPKFKIKKSNKYIQTGDNVNNSDTSYASPEETDSNSENDCKTPETITFGTTAEDQLLDKDIAADILAKIDEEQDSTNIDSAYETDYGISLLDQEQSFEEKNEPFWDENVPNSNQGLNYAAANFQPLYKENDAFDPDAVVGFNVERQEENKKEEGTAIQWTVQELWGSDYDPQHFGMDEQSDEKYHNIWSTGQDSLIPDMACLSVQEEQSESSLLFGESSGIVNFNFSSEDLLPDQHLDSGQIDGTINTDCLKTPPFEEEEADILSSSVKWSEAVCLDTGQLQNSFDPNSNAGFHDYVSVKLVYKDKNLGQDADDENQKSYGHYALMPMPDEAFYSSELEKEWLNPDEQSRFLKNSRFQRKPCTFFLEGNCRRTDCKYAHDISNITCRFWEEGECFKGPLCPFLHGYPSDTGPISEEEGKDKFELHPEDFPDLNQLHKPVASGKRTRPGRLQTSGCTMRKDNSRKQYRRKSSSKEVKQEFLDLGMKAIKKN